MSADNLKHNGPEGRSLILTIEGNQYQWNEQYITGAQIKKLGNLPDNAEVYLSVKHPWKDEQISDDEQINLARPEIENFYIKKSLKLIINGTPYEWAKQYITGHQIKALANIPADSEIFLSIQGPWEDEKVENETAVDLARPGIEHFYSKDLPVHLTIIVNGREKSWTKRTISFQEVVLLAFGTYSDADRTCYTVTYKGGPRENPKGTMVFGDTVFVQNKMIFNVTATDKS